MWIRKIACIRSTQLNVVAPLKWRTRSRDYKWGKSEACLLRPGNSKHIGFPITCLFFSYQAHAPIDRITPSVVVLIGKRAQSQMKIDLRPLRQEEANVDRTNLFIKLLFKHLRYECSLKRKRAPPWPSKNKWAMPRRHCVKLKHACSIGI